MDRKWKIKKPGGNIYGPVDIETIKKWIKEKRVLQEDFISPEDTEAWQAIKSIPEFADIFQPTIIQKEKHPSIKESTFKLKNAKGEEYGPANFQTITLWLKEKKIGEGTLVQKTEGGEWFPLNELPRLISSHDTNIQQKFLNSKDIDTKVQKIVTRIKTSVVITAAILFVIILSFSIQKATHLNRGTTGKEGINYWDYETKVASSEETITVPAGTFDNCYAINYHVDIVEGEKHYNIDGKRWYKTGIGTVKEKFKRYELSEDFNPFDTINFYGELTSYKGPGAREKPFPYIPKAQLEYQFTAEIDAPPALQGVTSVVAPPQNFKIIMTCRGNITLEDGKKYLKVVGTAGGPITRSEEFYRIEGDDIFFYGTSYMRNVSSPFKVDTLQPKVGSVFKNKITFDGTYSSTKQAKNIVIAFMMGRIGFLSGVMALLFLFGFIASFKHNIGNLEENIEQFIRASRQKGEVLAGEILGNIISWGTTLIFFSAFLIFVIFSFMSFF